MIASQKNELSDRGTYPMQALTLAALGLTAAADVYEHRIQTSRVSPGLVEPEA